jgi:hypothetical protein
MSVLNRVRRRNVVLAILLAAVAVLASTMFSSQSVGATPIPLPSKTLTIVDSATTAKCVITPKGTVATGIEVKLSAQAQPTSATGYDINIYTRVHCWIVDPNDGVTVLASYRPYAHSATLAAVGKLFTLPTRSDYILCGQVLTRFEDGTFLWSSKACD